MCIYNFDIMPSINVVPIVLILSLMADFFKQGLSGIKAPLEVYNINNDWLILTDSKASYHLPLYVC